MSSPDSTQQSPVAKDTNNPAESAAPPADTTSISSSLPQATTSLHLPVNAGKWMKVACRIMLFVLGASTVSYLTIWRFPGCDKVTMARKKWETLIDSGFWAAIFFNSYMESMIDNIRRSHANRATTNSSERTILSTSTTPRWLKCWTALNEACSLWISLQFIFFMLGSSQGRKYYGSEIMMHITKLSYRIIIIEVNNYVFSYMRNRIDKTSLSLLLVNILFLVGKVLHIFESNNEVLDTGGQKFNFPIMQVSRWTVRLCYYLVASETPRILYQTYLAKVDSAFNTADADQPNGEGKDIMESPLEKNTFYVIPPAHLSGSRIPKNIKSYPKSHYE